MIYCPRCDKPITPGHRCLSRRHFFGMLAALVPPAILLPALPVKPPAFELLGMPVISSAVVIISNQLYRIPIQLYRGGKLIAVNHEVTR